ncbi:MAG TPA: response regulator [Tepidisphaeraceae bacterium]|jgi:PAS domain S-box-containing protein|nr:response regulator [Tepidisphaeraceae bacterium]
MPDNRPTVVLVVDDTDASRYVVSRVLRSAGYEVKEAPTGREGLRCAQEMQPDLVVLDVNLPDINGFDVCRQLKSDPVTESIPVLHLSASYVRPQDQAYGLNQGADGYLTQPIEELVLTATVAALIRARRAEQGMRESEIRYRTLVEATSSIVWNTDAAGQMIESNESWGRFTGQSAEERAGFGWADAIYPEDRDAALHAWKSAVQRAESCTLEFRLRRLDGIYRYFIAKGAPLHSAGGTITGWIATCTDVSDHRLAEERVRHARDAAEAASKAKDRFLAVLSHELRTPLTPVVLSLASIEQHPDLPYELRADVAMVRRNIELETSLIDDLLDLSRVTSGKLRLQLRPTHIHELIEHVLENCAPDIQAKHITITRELSPSADVVHGDPTRIQQILWNVIRNAIKFTSEGGRIIVRTTVSGKGSPDLIIQITDTGIGIEPETLSKIFNAFEQGDPATTRQFGGLGLGLAICRAVAEMHGGSIWAESPGHGKGSTFSVRLPMTADQSTSAGPAKPLPDAATPAIGTRLLIVEDHPDTARVLAKLFRHSGYSVKTANTVAAALILAAAEPFDFMVSDLGLPDATGYELMRQIRTQSPSIKGIAMSGFGMEDDLLRSREAGFLDHVVKPVNFVDLEAAIRRVANSE